MVSFAQDTNTIYRYFQLDSIVIEASKNDLDVPAFIDYMIHDKSFYKAFRNLRSANYQFTNQIELFNRKNDVAASYNSEAVQFFEAPCRSMTEKNKKVTGNFLNKKGEYNYYTAKLYDRLFFTHGKVCIQDSSLETNNASKMENYVSELKKLMFDPGSDTHIPLMGNKTNIFDPQMSKYYTYQLKSVELAGHRTYLFDIAVKPEYQSRKENKTVIKRLLTWFDLGNKQILKRQYELEGNTIAYSFHVNMDVDITFDGHRYYPKEINYDGEWKIIGRKKENAKFKVLIQNFH